MRYITHCEKCNGPLSAPVAENRIAYAIFFCEKCRAEVGVEEARKRLYNPPELNSPYKP